MEAIIQDKAEQKRIYMREYARQRRAADPAFLERCRENVRKSREKHIDRALKNVAEWKANNKDKVSEYNKNYAQANKEAINKKRTETRKKNKDQKDLVSKAWKEKNKDHIKEWNRVYTSTRYKNDPVFALKINQRSRVRAILKNNKNCKTHELLGCSFEELKAHLESKFVTGMGWHNMGEWHIDHIVPLAVFDLSTEENQFLAFNYKNLQPLWAKDNLKKGAKYA